jgi:pimeloyl-ACP methyl ester carboxylesterase
LTKPDTFQRIYARVDPAISRSLQAFRRDQPLKQISACGETWDYVSFGQGAQTVLFLHGMAGAYDIWWQVLEKIADQYRIISITYPPVKCLASLAQGILAILAEEGMGKANIVGSSLGGYLAQYLVARHPERISRAVFANTFPPNDVIAGNTKVAGKLLPYVPSRLLMFGLRQNTEKRLYPASGHSEVLRAFLLEQYSGAMSKVQFLARYHCVVDCFVAPNPQVLGIPVLILEADNDPLVDISLREMLKETYPSAAVHSLGAVGHFAYLNAPDTYAGILRGFLASEPPGPGQA